jgi:hypothetical protein
VTTLNRLRDTLHAWDMPASIGGSVAEIGNRSAIAFDALDPAGKEAWRAEQRSQLSRFFPNVAEALVVVDRLVEQADHDVVATMAEHGFFSAPVIVQLHAHASRVMHRKSLK